MAARIDVGLARNDSYVFWRDEVYFKKFIRALVFRQESAIDTRVDPDSHLPQQSSAQLVNALDFGTSGAWSGI